MSDGRSSVSNAGSDVELAEYWDEHDLEDAWDPARKVDFEVDIETSRRYYPLEVTLARRVDAMAKSRGVRAETLLNLWVQEKLDEDQKAARDRTR